MVAWIAGGITILIFLVIAFQIDDWGRDWSQNTAELSESAERTGLRPVFLKQSPAEISAALRQWAEGSSRWSVVSERGDSEVESATIELKLTRTSSLFRFVDDVTVLMETENGRTAVNATSQSRVGKGDLGQNPRNLIELTTAIRDAFPKDADRENVD